MSYGITTSQSLNGVVRWARNVICVFFFSFLESWCWVHYIRNIYFFFKCFNYINALRDTANDLARRPFFCLRKVQSLLHCDLMKMLWSIVIDVHCSLDTFLSTMDKITGADAQRISKKRLPKKEPQTRWESAQEETPICGVSPSWKVQFQLLRMISCHTFTSCLLWENLAVICGDMVESLAVVSGPQRVVFLSLCEVVVHNDWWMPSSVHCLQYSRWFLRSSERCCVTTS